VTFAVRNAFSAWHKQEGAKPGTQDTILGTTFILNKSRLF
jgi:hypothetical protein